MSDKTFPIVVDTWTESERGWGCRPDGLSMHLSVADHKAFVAEFNAKHNNEPTVPDEYTTADSRPRVIDVPESLYQRLMNLRKEGKLGEFAPSREAEKQILAGKDPFTPKSFKVVATVVIHEQKLVTSSGKSAAEAEERVRKLLRNEGYEVASVKATLEDNT